jgi:hypothetical protein
MTGNCDENFNCCQRNSHVEHDCGFLDNEVKRLRNALEEIMLYDTEEGNEAFIIARRALEE